MGIVDQSGGRVSQAESLAADAGAQIKTHSSHGCFNLGLGTPARYRDNRKHRLTLYTRLSAAGLSPLSSRIIVSYVCLSLRFFSTCLCVHVCYVLCVSCFLYVCTLLSARRCVGRGGVYKSRGQRRRSCVYKRDSKGTNLAWSMYWFGWSSRDPSPCTLPPFLIFFSILIKLMHRQMRWLILNHWTSYSSFFFFF